MSGKVTETVRGGASPLLRLRELAGPRVRVGVLADQRMAPPAGRGANSKKQRTREKVARRAAEAGPAGAPSSLLQAAIVREFGGGAVPQRSFIRSTIDTKRAEIRSLQLALARKVLAGEVPPADALHQLGAQVADWMRKAISDGDAPEVEPAAAADQLRASITRTVAR